MYHLGFEGTAFVFRDFSFLKKPSHLLSIVYSQIVETRLLTAFYVSELIYSAVVITLKKNDCLAPYFFQEAFFFLTGRPIENLAKTQQECWR